MKNLLLTGIFTGIGLLTCGQQQLKAPVIFKGKVVNEKNKIPVPYASIVVSGIRKSVITDSGGHFQIAVSTNGVFKLAASAAGFYPAQKLIQPSDTSVILNLQEAESQLEEVVVTGVGTAIKLRSTPVAISVVSAKELSYHANTNAIDALSRSVPGLQSVTTGPNVSKPSIRGLGYNRVLTLFDGIRQEGQQWADEHGIEADQYNIMRAEVIKGPASIAYGSDAVAGVINIIPFIPAQRTASVKGNLLLEQHTNNNMVAASAGLYGFKKDFFWSGRGSVKMAKDYRNSVDGRVFNTGFKEWNISTLAGIKKAWGQSYVAFTSYNNLQEIPDGSRDSITRKFTRQIAEGLDDDLANRPVVSAAQLNSYETDPLHQHIRHIRLYSKTSIRWNNNTVNTAISFSTNNRQEYNHPTVPQQAGLYIVLNTLQFTTSWNKAFRNGLNGTAGINLMHQTNSSKNATDIPIPDYRMQDLGAFVMLEKEWKQLSVSGGLRYDKRCIQWNDFYTAVNPVTGFNYAIRNQLDTAGATLAFEQYRKSFTGITASFGITYTINPYLFVKANIARGYRSPNITEAGANGLDPGAHIYYIGNRNFVPETNWQQDMGVFLNLRGLEIGLELFNNKVSHYIYQQKLLDVAGQPVEIVPGNSTYGYQQGAANLYGFDGSLRYRPPHLSWLYVQSSISAVTGVNKDELLLKQYGRQAKYLPLISPLRFINAVRFDFPASSLLTAPYLRLEVDTYAAQHKFYGVQQTETATPAYGLFNAGFGCAISNKREKQLVNVSIHAENIFNIVYQSHLNRLKYFETYAASPTGRTGIYNMGRNVSFKTIFNF